MTDREFEVYGGWYWPETEIVVVSAATPKKAVELAWPKLEGKPGASLAHARRKGEPHSAAATFIPRRPRD